METIMAKRIKILFVDDEPNILDGLRRMLRPMREEWDAAFAQGGKQALDALADAPFDIIVSDMRMPGMDGLELLTEVRERFPQVIRLALSGQTSKETILHSVGPIHQYMPKPCDADNLKSTVARVCSLRDVLMNDKLQGLISQLESLPCMPSLQLELMKELRSEEASIDHVAELISQDVGMSAKIMQIVNSAFFGLRQPVSRITHAVTLLGLDTITALGVSSQVFSQFDEITVDGFSLSALWSHSLTVGKWAKAIAATENADQGTVDHAVISGMLHDVGKLVLAAKLPAEYQLAIQLQGSSELSLSEAEKEIIAATHGEVGAYLLGLWGFSHAVIEAVNFHHNPGEARGDSLSPLTVVHVANAWADLTAPDDHGAPGDSFVNEAYLQRLGLSERLPVWRDKCGATPEVPCG